MASPAQVAANQANARRSTGPRTAGGKAASARNSTDHGLCSKDFVILEGQDQEFSDFMDDLRAAIQPAGAIELDLYAQHAHASWGLRRCRRAEVACQLDPRCNGTDPLLNYNMANRLKRIDLYARRAERTYHKTLKELQALQTIRLSIEILAPDETTIDPLPPLPTLVNPLHLNRQRAAEARAQAAIDKAAENDIFRRTSEYLDNMRAQQLEPNSELNNQTQSPAPTSYAAGGPR